jgi:drug/metabolite transporter (DMT)-like permease
MSDQRSATIAYTAMALVAFAANSVLCRMALREGAIDAASFSTLRFGSGAVILVLLASRGQRPLFPLSGSWTSAAVLALYALPFAFAYTQLSTGTGALVLFGSVQVTMLVAALVSGERPHVVQWVGLIVALAGLVILVLPGLTAPSPLGAALMATAGVAWGFYSLWGRGASDPLSLTTGNFVRVVPLVIAGSILVVPRIHAEPAGIVLALLSGAVASGLGYVAWYAALRKLSAMRASVLQLAPPPIAAASGVVLLGEMVTLRLVLSTILVLGGIALAIVAGRSSRAVRSS